MGYYISLLGCGDKGFLEYKFYPYIIKLINLISS